MWQKKIFGTVEAAWGVVFGTESTGNGLCHCSTLEGGRDWMVAQQH